MCCTQRPTWWVSVDVHCTVSLSKRDVILGHSVQRAHLVVDVIVGRDAAWHQLDLTELLTSINAWHITQLVHVHAQNVDIGLC